MVYLSALLSAALVYLSALLSAALVYLSALLSGVEDSTIVDIHTVESHHRNNTV
jgi:hypothetical protein